MDNKTAIGCPAHSHNRPNIELNPEILPAITTAETFKKKANAFVFQNVGNVTAYLTQGFNKWTILPSGTKTYGNPSNTDLVNLDFKISFDAGQIVNPNSPRVQRIEIEKFITKNCPCPVCENK